MILGQNISSSETNKMNNFCRLIQGDCLKVLPTLPEESIDLIVTDPPYQLFSTSRSRQDQTKNGSYGHETPFSRQQSRIRGFMDKEWDVLPSVEIWKECLRVLKPGAFAFIMCTPRLDSLSQMVVRLQEAGFNVGFTPIYWAYASGFPKAENISKAVDKRLGVEREVIGFDSEKFKKIANNPPMRPSKGYNQNSMTAEGACYLTNPSSNEAKALDGSYGGMQLKPAVEIVIVAMKMLSEKTFVDQALKNRHGITYLDDCRIPFQNKDDYDNATRPNCDGKPYPEHPEHEHIYGKGLSNQKGTSNIKGRFPANLLVSDNILDNGKEHISGGGKKNKLGTQWVESGRQRLEYSYAQEYVKNSGGFSRFFSLDAWWTEAVKKLPVEVQKTFPFIICPKASKSERDKGLEGLPLQHAPTHNVEGRDLTNPKNILRPGMQDRIARNVHPTVKPLKLMSYLITLGSREGDVVLDPFLGSGTTMLAASVLGRSCVGIELMREYCEIAKARVFHQKRLGSEYCFEAV